MDVGAFSQHELAHQSTSDSEDEDADTSSELSDGDDLAEDFESAMDNNFGFIGDYAYGSILPQAPNPAISLQDIGLIGLPLSPRDAQMIIESAKQAPYGHADCTLVNRDVRHTWEIQPNQLVFANPDWQNFVDKTAQSVCEKLGVRVEKAALQCELYKLLLYEPGSHFLSHQDTVKTPGMFATVIIILPSQYSGGEVHVSHSGKSKVLDFSASSLLGTTVLAWYTDVHHEVRPVTTGYRLALSYNLVQTAPGPPPSVPDNSEAVGEIQKVLKRWRNDQFVSGGDLDFLAYILDHQYSASGLTQGINALKGEDMQKLAYLRPQATELGFKLFLGNMSCHVSGEADEDSYGYGGGWGRRRSYGRYRGYGDDDSEEKVPEMGEELDRSYSVENLVDLDGRKLLDNGAALPLEAEQVVPSNAFEDVEPDKKTYEGYMGNWSGSVDHYYRRAVLIVMQEDRAESILIGAGGVQYSLSVLNQSKQSPPTAENLRLAEVIMQKVSGHQTTILEEMYNNSMSWSHVGLWKRVLSKHPGITLKKLIQAGETFGFDAVQDTYDKTMAKGLPLDQRISFADQVVNNISQKSPELVDRVKAWREAKLNELANSFQSPAAHDVAGLMLLTDRLGYTSCAEKIVPRLAKNASTTYPFWVAFAKALHIKKASVTGDTCLADLDRLLDACINVVAPLWESVVAQPYYSGAQNSKVDRVVELLDLCIATKHMPHCKLILASVLKSAGTIANKFATLYIPLISRLPECLRKHNMDILSPPFGELLQIFVGQYLHEVLGAKPRMSRINMRRLGCGCADCQVVDTFLMGKTTEITLRLPMARKSHIEQRVSPAPDLVRYAIIRQGSPHAIHIVKKAEIVAVGQWEAKVQEAKRFLMQVGGRETLIKLMAHRYVDIKKALDGSQQFLLPINRPTTTDQTVSVQGNSEDSQGIKRKAT